MTDPFFQAIVSGFVLYSLIILIIQPFINEQVKNGIERFDQSASMLMAIAGLIHLFFWIINLIGSFKIIDDQAETYIMKTRLTGAYSVAYLVQPFLILVSQLLWSEKLRSVKWIRFVITLVFIISIENITVYFTLANRDYLPSSWSTRINSTIIGWTLGFGTFIFLSAVFHFVKTRLSTKRRNLD